MSEIIQLKSAIGNSEALTTEAATTPVAAHDAEPAPANLAALRTRLSAKQGKAYWRSLEELAESDQFYELLHREFPEQASEWHDPKGRRKFLKLMGASLALAGLTACTRQPTEYIAPYAKQPEEVIPGKPLFYATAMPLSGGATGLLIESHEGRPTKVEGNPDHPASQGATDIYAQAAMLGLYDPDRSRTITYLAEISKWPSLLGAIEATLTQQRSAELQGAGIRILTEHVTSPTLAYQIKSLLADFPKAKWHQYEPTANDAAREGARQAFGQYTNSIYHLDKADIIVSLDADFLGNGPAAVRYAREFANKRRLDEENHEMSRLYTIESSITITGAVADHRLPVRPSEVETLARALAAKLGVGGAASATAHDKWIDALANDLKNHRGASVVIAGDSQPPIVHVLAHAINKALDNVDKTVSYTEPVEANPVDGLASLRELVQDMDAGQVDTLLMLGGNPVYNAPADLDFTRKMTDKVRLRIHLSLYTDETSQLCHWHIPEAHFLESWSDARAFDGTASIIQPLIAPLYGGKTAHEMLAAFTPQPERKSYDIVRDYWQRRFAAGGAEPAVTPSKAATAAPAASDTFEQSWRKALHDGTIPNTAAKPKAVTVAASIAAPTATPASGYEIAFRPDPSIHDGRFANNAWLQELPKPLNKLTWDNAALVSPATAVKLNLGKKQGDFMTNVIGDIGGEIIADVVKLDYKGRSLNIPVFIQVGHPDDCVTVHLGYGRTSAGKVGNGTGFNAYGLRTSDAPGFGSGAQINKTGDTYSLATTQLQSMLDVTDVKNAGLEDRDIIRSGSLADYKKNPRLTEKKEEAGTPPSMFPPWDYSQGYAWGMAIDMSSCIGCNACIIACQSENNIPVVGKEQVLRHRAMHWLRVDGYHKGSEANPETYFQPIPCQQCEQAPCEVVCPVAATVHSAEGLNDMVYNRCVGTRYCSNNCPYKVRRFNFLLYQDFYTESLKMMRNPEVSVRSRGVMEKCNYCVQRIQRSKIESEKEGRPVRDGEIVTACAQVCPTEAIVFGNKNDPASRVAKLKAQERNYNLLDELNTKPRTTYLGAVKNPNPELEKV